MEKVKRKTPYQMLLEDIKAWCRKVRYRDERGMWTYPKDKLDEGWDLTHLYERTKAAEQLGYDTQLVAADTGLVVRYVKKLPEIPYRWR